MHATTLLRFRGRSSALLVGSFLSLASLALGGAAAAQAPAVSDTAPALSVADHDPGYRLGAGDKVRITVFGEAGMTGDYAVTPSGEISFPLIGGVGARGRTLLDLAQDIRGRLMEGYIHDPRVAIDLLEYRSFFILGEVNKPGAYPYTSGLTLGKAIATAGGYTYRARKSKVTVRHDGSAQDTEVKVEDSGGLVLQPGDTVVIPERFF